jgi:hypothetical protein
MRRILVPTALALLGAASGHADQLLLQGSFERPKVEARTPSTRGANPAFAGPPYNWAQLIVQNTSSSSGSVTAGITNEWGHTGRQSIYIDFDQFTGKSAGVTLTSRAIPVQPAKPYRVAIWGRIDHQRPLTLSQRQPYLKLIAEFLQADSITPAGTTEFRVHPLPDHRIRIGERPPLFNSTSWSEFPVELSAPEDAALLRITWKVETPRDEGTTSGVFYLDDATLSGEPAPPPSSESPSTPDTTTEPETASPQPVAPPRLKKPAR